MTVAIALSALAGMAIGFRFTVLMTVPALLAAMGATAAIAVNAGDHTGALLCNIALSGIAVQLGYFCGSFAPLLPNAPLVHQDERRLAQANSHRLVSE
jgi:hypothetical protein